MPKPYDSNHCCVLIYQQWLSPFSPSCFDGIIANLEYLHLESSQIPWILINDRNNASAIIGDAPSPPKLYHGEPNALLLIMQSVLTHHNKG